VSDPRADFLSRAARGGVVPLAREIVLDADSALAAYAKIARPPYGFLLESAVGGERWARYTFLGTEPREVWRYRGRAIECWTPAQGWRAAGETADPIGHVAQRLRALTPVVTPGLPPFSGGAVGYLGYDLVRTIERLPEPPADTLGLPDAVVMLTDSLVVLDNLFGRAIAVANVEVAPDAPARERVRLYGLPKHDSTSWWAACRPAYVGTAGAFRARAAVTTTSRYARRFRARRPPRAGAHRRRGRLPDGAVAPPGNRRDGGPLRLYRFLRALNPAPTCSLAPMRSPW
jgi:anthranilate synthase component 1